MTQVQLEKSDATPWREVAGRRGSVPASILRGSSHRRSTVGTPVTWLIMVMAGGMTK